MKDVSGISIDWRPCLTQAAFFLLLALVAARCTILESIREPFNVSPGMSSYPRGPDAATSIGLDIVSCLPALLILARRVLDKTYSIRITPVHGLMLAMTLWMCLSAKWADDRFAAVISSANFAAAMVILWSASQLVRSWTRLRIVSAVAFGLLLVLLVQGFYYKFVEMPDLMRNFEQNKALYLHDRGISAGSFTAKQFEQKTSELLGFSASANSFAGIIVLLLVIGVGITIQQIQDRDPRELIAAIAITIPLAGWLLFYTQSKAAMVTPVLALLFFAILWKFRATLAARSVRYFRLGTAATFFAIFAVIGHGLFHHGLPTASLNFRWRYWVASWRMFLRHPICGVGWDNFGIHYLRDRLPSASEEIRDPHNFLVRFFVELGLIGGALAITWFLRLWWEFTRPVVPPFVPSPVDKKRSGSAVGFLISIALAAITINVIASLDFSQKADFLILELMKRSLYLCALAAGTLLVALRWTQQPRLDDRPATWILYGILVSLGVFLIHNLIEFSFFDTSASCLFGLLAGAALGVRTRSPKRILKPLGAFALLAIVLIGWVLTGLFLWLPIARAESAARQGDDAFRAADFDKAVQDYQTAFEAVPYNGDYAFHAGSALHYEVAAMMAAHRVVMVPQELRVQILAYYGLAIDRNPSNITAYLARAQFALQLPDQKQVLADFDKAIELNPNEVSIHRDYARALRLLDMPEKAAVQLQLALKLNDQLDPAEPKRLSPEEVDAIHHEIDVLKSAATN